MARPVYEVAPIDPNLFTGPSRLLAGPARTGSVTLDTHFGEFARWLYVGTTGNITYVKWDGTTQALVGVAAGFWHPIYAVQVNTAGTTASNLVWGS